MSFQVCADWCEHSSIRFPVYVLTDAATCVALYMFVCMSVSMCVCRRVSMTVLMWICLGNNIDNPMARDRVAYDKLRESYADSKLLLTGQPFNYRPTSKVSNCIVC